MSNKNGIPILTGPYVNGSVALTATAANLNLSENSNYWAELFRRVPFRKYGYSGWTKAAIISGDGWGLENTVDVHTTTAASNSGCTVIKTNDNAICPGSLVSYFPFSRRAIIFIPAFLRYGSVAACFGRFQIKQAASEGIAADKSFGLEIRNLALYGETYGSSQGYTAKLCDMSEYINVGLIIDHQPATPKIDFYVDTGAGFPAFGTPTATVTTSAQIPQTNAAAQTYFVWSIIKDATATNCELLASEIYVGIF